MMPFADEITNWPEAFVWAAMIAGFAYIMGMVIKHAPKPP